MIARPSIMGRLAHSRLLRETWPRRALLGVLTLLCLLLSAFPERYRAASSLTPTDPSSLGLSGALGQLGALSTVFGSQAAVEISLKVGQSVFTRHEVIRRLDLVKRLDMSDEVHASRWLDRNVELRSLRGGIVQVEVLNRDPAFAEQLVRTTTDVMSEQLTQIQIRQTQYKRQILMKLVADANIRLAKAEAAYNTFRLSNRYTDPGLSIGAFSQRKPALESQIRDHEMQLSAARQFFTDDNIAIKQLLAQMSALKSQLATIEALNPADQNSISRVVAQSTEVERLDRELGLAKSLYYSYRRFLEGTSVEDLTSSANIRILEKPYIDTERQYRLLPLALAALLVLLAGAIEFYQLRPPIGSREAEA